MLDCSCSFNKKEEDFPDLRSYNDYLEMIETVGEWVDGSRQNNEMEKL